MEAVLDLTNIYSACNASYASLVLEPPKQQCTLLRRYFPQPRMLDDVDRAQSFVHCSIPMRTLCDNLGYYPL